MVLARRSFIASIAGLLAAVTAFVVRSLLPRRAVASDWLIRRATPADAAALVTIFNAQLEAGSCAYADKIEPWNRQKVMGFLQVYTGTIVLALDGQPVGFAAYVDFGAADPRNSIAPDVDAEIVAFAVNPRSLDHGQQVYAVKAIAAAIGRDMARMNFKGVRATISAISGFPPLPNRSTSVVGTHERDGATHARDVRYDVRPMLEELTREGF